MADHPLSPTAAVLVVDLQTAMFDGVLSPPLHDADALVARVRRILDWARASGRKIAFIRHEETAGEPLAKGAPGWPIWPALGQGEDEPTFPKTVGDAFSEPTLGAWLKAAGADEVILLGAQTDQCVAATVQGALANGYAVTVSGDAHSTWDFGGETAAAIIARHNQDFASAGVRMVTTEQLTLGAP
jgi:nicotinamidase-related amidase